MIEKNISDLKKIRLGCIYVHSNMNIIYNTHFFDLKMHNVNDRYVIIDM